MKLASVWYRLGVLCTYCFDYAVFCETTSILSSTMEG